MPFVVRQYSKDEKDKAFSRLTTLADIDTLFIADGFLAAFPQFNDHYKLTLLQGFGLVRALNAYLLDDSLPKSTLHKLLGLHAKDWTKPLPDHFASFFLFSSKGFTLSAAGLQVMAYWGTLLRRVLQDREYFFNLKYGRFTPEEREKRRLNKRFYKDLDDLQRIAILRDYYSMPFRTDDEKQARKTRRIELYHKYDLVNWDLINAIQRYGQLVKSVRLQPQYIGMFPDYSKRSKSDT